MDLHLDLGEEGGLVEQIYAQLHERISSDALPPGTVLPSSRELAARLSVSRATVVAAYERLAATGLGHAGGTQEFTGGTGRYVGATGFTYLNQHWEVDHFATQIQGEVCRPKS